MGNSQRLVNGILAVSALLGALCAAALGALMGHRAGLSSLAGTAVGMGNLWALARLVGVVTDPASRGPRRLRAALLLGAKSVALIVLIGFLVVTGVVSGVALMAGLSMVALGIVVGGVLRSTDDDEDAAAFVPRKEP